MHNLFMGLAKHSMSVWKDRGLLTPAAMLDIQDTINNFEVPTDVGRIPGKIASGFADFTADQWKHWIIVYSLIALKNRLPDRNYKCWTKFVHACILFCSVRLTPNIIRQAHTHIVEFCQEFQRLYGNAACTINMHLACHMSNCLEDFGPVHSFWCFAFERLKGQLGAIPTNNLSVEVQLMQKFVDGMFINSYIPQLQKSPEVQTLLQLLKHPTKRGTIGSFNQSIDDLPMQTTYTGTDREFTTDELTRMII